jgi:enoyl-CoA hydratase/carnithine racemase
MTGHPLSDARYSQYEVADRVAAITIDRPQKANAQNERMLDELDACFTAAAKDPDVGVIVLRANGKHFSAGHDLETGTPDQVSLAQPDGTYHLQDMYRWEAEKYLGYGIRWRNIPKPTIAAVQGRCIAGALNLVFPMDLIVAAENAQFEDPVVTMAIGGVEYHGHTWDFGARRAKDVLFTGRAIGALEAQQIGLVRDVVPLERLQEHTLDLARTIAKKHPFGLSQAKRAVNQTLDVQGFYAALQAVFDMHHTGHGNAISISGYPILVGLDEMKAQLKGSNGS